MSDQYRSALEYDIATGFLDLVVLEKSQFSKARRKEPTIQGSSLELFDAIFAAFRRHVETLMAGEEFDSILGRLLDPRSYRIVPGPPRRIEFELGVIAAFHESADRELGPPLAHELSQNVLKAVSEIFLSGRSKAGAQIGAGRDEFNVENKHAIQVLQKQTVFWIGNAYDQRLKSQINQTIEHVATQGLGPREGRDALKAALGDTFNRSDSYWYILAHAALGRAANYGTLSRYKEFEIEGYTWVATKDEVVCPICKFLDGRSFTTEKAGEFVDRVLAAEDPADVRRNHPWLRFDRKRALSGKESIWFRTTDDGLPPDDPADDLTTRSYLPGTTFDFVNGQFVPKGSHDDHGINRELESMGKILPPIHARCRCDTVISQHAIDAYVHRRKS